ncbi:hypothetical protein MHYP_G00074740 [Metynnis hypsauchen]
MIDLANMSITVASQCRKHQRPQSHPRPNSSTQTAVAVPVSLMSTGEVLASLCGLSGASPLSLPLARSLDRVTLLFREPPAESEREKAYM